MDPLSSPPKDAKLDSGYYSGYPRTSCTAQISGQILSIAGPAHKIGPNAQATSTSTSQTMSENVPASVTTPETCDSNIVRERRRQTVLFIDEGGRVRTVETRAKNPTNTIKKVCNSIVPAVTSPTIASPKLEQEILRRHDQKILCTEAYFGQAAKFSAKIVHEAPAQACEETAGIAKAVEDQHKLAQEAPKSSKSTAQSTMEHVQGVHKQPEVVDVPVSKVKKTTPSHEQTGKTEMKIAAAGAGKTVWKRITSMFKAAAGAIGSTLDPATDVVKPAAVSAALGQTASSSLKASSVTAISGQSTSACSVSRFDVPTTATVAPAPAPAPATPARPTPSRSAPTSTGIVHAASALGTKGSIQPRALSSAPQVDDKPRAAPEFRAGDILFCFPGAYQGNRDPYEHLQNIRNKPCVVLPGSASGSPDSVYICNITSLAGYSLDTLLGITRVKKQKYLAIGTKLNPNPRPGHPTIQLAGCLSMPRASRISYVNANKRYLCPKESLKQMRESAYLGHHRLDAASLRILETVIAKSTTS